MKYGLQENSLLLGKIFFILAFNETNNLICHIKVRFVLIFGIPQLCFNMYLTLLSQIGSPILNSITEGVQSLYWLSMNLKLLFALHYILLSGTATTQYMDSCRPRRQVHGHAVYGLQIAVRCLYWLSMNLKLLFALYHILLSGTATTQYANWMDS